METINLAESDGLPATDWADIAEKLNAGSAPDPAELNARTTWLSTINEDGSPHVTGVGAMWVDGTFWFETGKDTRKGRNVARDPRCSIAVSIRDADVVILNYQRLANAIPDLTAWMGNRKVHLVVDEAHRAKRGTRGEWGRALMALAPLAARRDILTGTPAGVGPITDGSVVSVEIEGIGTLANPVRSR